MESNIDRIIGIEWVMFDKVQNIAGRASCQDDFDTFEIMRRSQFCVWSDELRDSYLADLLDAYANERNLVEEKYAYMMEYSSPEEFALIRNQLPPISLNKRPLIRQITEKHLAMYEAMLEAYPLVANQGRHIYSDQDAPDDISIETYMLGELATYSMHTLELYNQFMDEMGINGVNVPYKMIENTVKRYNIDSLETAEAQLQQRDFTE
ncbi:MAG: DUF4125 family protein [Clostridiales Family XIII bacterium]|jgi:hypothetical protein|nr:DUF4125 family protein [Clostridiales Family XIII bacterium]